MGSFRRAMISRALFRYFASFSKSSSLGKFSQNSFMMTSIVSFSGMSMSATICFDATRAFARSARMFARMSG